VREGKTRPEGGGGAEEWPWEVQATGVGDGATNTQEQTQRGVNTNGSYGGGGVMGKVEPPQPGGTGRKRGAQSALRYLEKTLQGGKKSGFKC